MHSCVSHIYKYQAHVLLYGAGDHIMFSKYVNISWLVCYLFFALGFLVFFFILKAKGAQAMRLIFSSKSQ